MPWHETGPMEQRMHFVVACEREPTSLTEQCRRFGISRKTGYKWLQRYREEGVAGLEERSRARHTPPEQLDPELARSLLELKSAHPDWGPRKVRGWWALRAPVTAKVPAASTIGELFRAHGLTRPRQQRHRSPPYNEPFQHCDAPNCVWSADFKGQFRLGNGRWCYPLTVTDNYSRFLLDCQGCYGTGHAGVYRCLDRLFREYGLPEALRTDNGSPFAGTGLAGLSRLSVWLIRLGVFPERIQQGKPQQNGRHERMHGSLKAGLEHNGYKADLAAQQRWFNRFREEFNHQRPHEALGDEPPAWHHWSSPRRYDGHVPELEYPEQAQVRRVRSSGEVKWQGELVFVSTALIGEHIALTQTDEHLWQLHFGPVLLAYWDEIRRELIRPEKS